MGVKWKTHVNTLFNHSRPLRKTTFPLLTLLISMWHISYAGWEGLDG